MGQEAKRQRLHQSPPIVDATVAAGASTAASTANNASRRRLLRGRRVIRGNQSISNQMQNIDIDEDDDIVETVDSDVAIGSETLIPIITESIEPTPISATLTNNLASVVTPSTASGEASQIPDGIDPSFLAALPEEMRDEVIAEHMR